MKEKRSFAPVVVAIVLLLVPVLYVGSYLTLVVPAGNWDKVPGGHGANFALQGYYRVRKIDPFFWPLEKIDRKVRPKSWQRPSGLFDSPRARQIEENLGGDY
jgi:uncharacterized ion transporter superfamily protein YfcC